MKESALQPLLRCRFFLYIMRAQLLAPNFFLFKSVAAGDTAISHF